MKIVHFCLRGGVFAHTTAGKTRWKGVIFSMRKVVLCLFYGLCAFAIAFSLFWMALPRLALPSPAPGADSAAETPVPSGPSLAAQTLSLIHI